MVQIKRPHLGQLKTQAKELVKLVAAGDAAALTRLRNHHPEFLKAVRIESIRLHDAQLVIAREQGQESWPKLKAEVERLSQPELSPKQRFLEAILHGNAEVVESYLSDVSTLPPALAGEAALVLPKIVNRSVWHRPQYHRIAKKLAAAGVPCSIWDAARAGLRGVVQSWLERDPGALNAPDPQGRTPLQRAALIYGTHPECEEVVQDLLGRGADVDLFTACTFGMLKQVEQAIAADPGSVHRTAQGASALNWAVRPRVDGGESNTATSIEICRKLIEAGAALDSRDLFEDGMQPLHHVAEWGNEPALAAFLIDRGANPDALADNGWTPLDYALDRDRKPMTDFFKSRGAKQTRIDWPNEFGERRDLLIASAQRGDLATVRALLLETPSLVSAREANGATALHWAAHNGFHQIAELLLKHGADPSAQETNLWGGTPLHWAAEREAALVELLLAHGADIGSRNCRTGQTPLHYCARCDDAPEVAEILLLAGARIDAADNAGRTPLDYAIQAEHDDVAGVLRAWAQAHPA